MSLSKHLGDDIGVYAAVADGIASPRLPDNLGPNVSIPDPAPPRVAPQPDEPARADFVKIRNRILSILGVIVFVDIGAGLPFWVTVVPQAALRYALYKKWRDYRDDSAAS